MVFRDVSSGSVRGERGKWGVGNRCGRFCGGNSGVRDRKFKNAVVGREGEVRGEVSMGWENQVSLYIWMLKADCKGCGRGA